MLNEGGKVTLTDFPEPTLLAYGYMHLIKPKKI